MKKTRKTITRREILKAIRQEPLRRGTWVKLDDFCSWKASDDPECSVCAVGAVLRHSGLNNEQIDEFGDQMVFSPFPCTSDGLTRSALIETMNDALKEKRYLHALSLQFEHHSKRLGRGERIRNLLANFVKKNFPKKIRLNPNF